MNRRRRSQGFSLLEVLLFSAISCFALVCVAQFINKPLMMQRIMTSAETPLEAARAMDRLVNDLKEAVPGSVQWDVATSTAPLVFAKALLNPATLHYDVLSIGYGFEGPKNGPGRLVRVEASTRTVVLEPVDPPTEKNPIFDYDRSLRIIMVDLHYHPVGRPAIRLVRRVALSQ